MRLARAWQRAHISISRADERGVLRFAFPVSATGVQATPFLSSSASTRPLLGASACQSPCRFAHATWLPPGP
jgi:hypothetical protein